MDTRQRMGRESAPRDASRTARDRDSPPVHPPSKRVVMIHPASLVLACAALLGAPSLAQSERTLRDEMAFARELAVRYQYMDLAESVLGELGKGKLSEKQKESLALVQSQVFTEGAKREGDAKKRLETFERASQSF